MTILEAYAPFTERLKTIYEDREAATIADWVFEKVTGLKRWERKENQDKQLEENQSKQIDTYLEELLQHKPVQYVLNEAWFYKMKFFVDENVLIPRPETEELVEWVTRDFKNQIHSKPTNILDIGSGSGCISIALKKELAHFKITSIDVSEKALKVAKKNAENLKVKIDFLQLNFLNESEWKSLPIYDAIISNPPYIPINEKENLANNVTNFEPGIALFVETADPIIFYKKIADFAKGHLRKDGRIYVETHEEYAKEVKAVFENAGYLSEIKKDIYGKERMVRAKKV
ncbi:MAG: peptide chain release factor N(5)-glutamine methyltransferase [Ginsengibacter sp.]